MTSTYMLLLWTTAILVLKTNSNWTHILNSTNCSYIWYMNENLHIFRWGCTYHFNQIQNDYCILHLKIFITEKKICKKNAIQPIMLHYDWRTCGSKTHLIHRFLDSCALCMLLIWNEWISGMQCRLATPWHSRNTAWNNMDI